MNTIQLIVLLQLLIILQLLYQAWLEAENWLLHCGILHCGICLTPDYYIVVAVHNIELSNP